jgi:DNA-binding transcriptional LysR family regulator
MDLNRIATFVRVVETESFTAAARALQVSKSSISRVVSQLEEELGVRLLQRTTRKLRLTDAGRAYYARARHALAELDEATVDVAEMGEEPRGVVRLTAPIDISLMLLGEIVRSFTLKYPLIHVDLSLTSRVVDLVEEGFDLALRGGILEDSTLIARKVGATALGLFASPEYVGLHGQPKTLTELATHACVLFRARGGKANWRLNGPNGEESVEVTGPISSDDFAFTRRAIELGMGIGAFPLFMAGGCPNPGALVRILPDYTLFEGGSLYVVMPSMRHVPARVTLFREHLIESLTALEWGPVAYNSRHPAKVVPRRRSSSGV